MEKILIGDYRWSLSTKESSRKAPHQVILDEETVLAHSYNKVLLEKPGLIRTPTALCNKSYLPSDYHQDRVEAVHTIAVAVGKEAISRSGSDTLLAGTIGPYFKPEGSTRIEEYEQIFGEPAIYMVDRGVDVLLLEGFSDFHEFQIAVRTMRRINSVPIPLAAFFKMERFEKKLFNDVIQFGEQMELELIGFELSIDTIALLPDSPVSGKSALGFQVSWDNNHVDTSSHFEEVADKLRTYHPTMLLGGAGTDAESWGKFIKPLST